jgi:hypothetical protein
LIFAFFCGFSEKRKTRIDLPKDYSTILGGKDDETDDLASRRKGYEG